MDPDGISTVLEDASSPTAPVRRYEEDDDDDGLAGDDSGARDVGGFTSIFIHTVVRPQQRTTTIRRRRYSLRRGIDTHPNGGESVRASCVDNASPPAEEAKTRKNNGDGSVRPVTRRRRTTTQSSMDGDGEGNTDGVRTPSFFDDVYSRSVLVVEDELSVPPSTHDNGGAADTDCNKNDDDDNDNHNDDDDGDDNNDIHNIAEEFVNSLSTDKKMK